ncbi:MAG: tripartite tricarboxylate transporter substrate binding protein [Alphaproteobacteria bacterium]|nr:tripartite tricarboxylate transporter substrate binding protein [Alphaproteobacteria bacterium]
MIRRRSLVTSMLAAPAVLGAASARAQGAWPNKPVKLILPYAPGGATDIIGRPWADKLGQAFGQPFVIDNRGGAAGGIGTEAVAKSANDGYTFLLTPAGPLTVLPHLRKVAYGVPKELVTVARVGDLVCGFTIRPELGINTMAELVAYAKKNPGKLAYGSAGAGSSTHMRIEALKAAAGIDILHVPYRGSADALNDLLAGNVHMMNEINVIPHIKAGKLKLLSVSYPTRHPDFPDVPTLTEAGFPSIDVPIWYAIWAPAGTPKDIIAAFNAKCREIAATPDMLQRMQSINVVVPPETPEQMLAYFEKDFAANGQLIRDKKITLDG